MADDDLADVLASLRDNIRLLTEVEQERRQDLEVRQDDVEDRLRDAENSLSAFGERLGQLHGVRETLYGPRGQNGLVGDVRDLKRDAAEAKEQRAEFRSGLLWPIAAAILSSIFAALIIQRLT